MEGFLTLLGIVVFALIIFIIYFIFKILQFVIQAINLYKKIVNRQDAMLKLLLDIRDNTKKYSSTQPGEVEDVSSSADDDTFICDNCKAEVPADAKKCPKCGAQFE